jgi:predicted esterase
MKKCYPKAIYWLSMSCMLLTCLRTYAQTLPTGAQVTTFRSEADDSEQPYGLYLPENYNPNQKYPLVIMLHGAGSNHRLALRRVFGKSNTAEENDVEASRYFPPFRKVDYIVASPLARGTMGYQGIAEKDVLDVLEDVKSRFSVDEDRVYLTGLSMGGGGTLWIGLNYPDKWAALAPVCPATLDETVHLMPNGSNLPMHFFQGAADQVVKADSTKQWIARLKAEGATVEYTEYEGVQHNSWVNAYQEGFIFDWFAKHKRNRFPDKIQFATPDLKHGKAWWLQLESIAVGKVARIDAAFTNLNQLKINTIDINAFTLYLGKHPKFSAEKILKIQIDTQMLRVVMMDSVSLLKEGNQWRANQFFTPAPNAKRKGAEGHLAEAISDRHIYVYGTADNPPAAVLEKRRLEAEKAGNWSVYRGEFLKRVMIFPRVLSDKEVRPSDWKMANLILMGTVKTNLCMAKIANKLPMQLTDTTGKYGLLYILPSENNRYIVINSGIPVLDVPEMDTNAWKKRWFPPMALAMSKLKDFVLYDKNKVIINDWFDEYWRIKPANIPILKKSKVIQF